MNFLRRCVRATATLPPPSSLSSRTFLRPATRSSPYSTNLWSLEHPSSSIRSPELNEQTKNPMVADSSRPREIPYQVKVANLVKLLGHIKLPVKFQSFRDGKHYAATLISDTNIPIDKACLIPVLFEGDLAHVVSCHVKENDCVYVTGKLCSDPFPFVLQENQWRLHILAEDINFVEGFDEKAQEDSRKKEIVDNVKNSRGKTGAQDLKERDVWRDLMKNPNQWLNFADDKAKGLVSPKHPDFKHTENGSALWLGRAPEWFVARIETLDLDSRCSKERMWKSLAENPDQWWDNRVDKKTEKAPDFKHRKTGAGLWLGDKPEWFVAKDIGKVKDTKAEGWKSLVENPSQWWDNRLVKKNVKAPDFKHKESGEGLWLNCAPDWAVSKLPPLKQNLNVGGV